MPGNSADFGQAVADRIAAHEREQAARRSWRIAVGVTSLAFLITYLGLLFVVRVTEPFYLIVNLLSITTGLCGFIVFRAYELPTILAELPRLSDQDRCITLAAIEPIRAELLATALPSLGLTRSREQAVALDDDELVRRLAGLQRPNWRKIAPACFVAWLIVVSTAFVGIATYRPEHGVSLIERLQGHKPAIDQRWSPKW